MSAYRFCRSDDIGLLVAALNRCWAPYFPDEPPVTPAVFKRSIRDLQVWCSSCMVAFSGPDPIAVLIGAKRPSGTLIHRFAVHPDHRRQGHGRHLLDSLGSKLAILGPPRIVAEVPETLAPACELLGTNGYVQEAVLTDYVLETGACPEPRSLPRGSPNEGERERAASNGASRTGYVIPVTLDDLAANGLLDQAAPHTCWQRSIETLTARKDDIYGLAVASDEHIEACVLYIKDGEVLSLRTFVEDGGARLHELLSRLRAQGMSMVRLPKVHPAEMSSELLETLGFCSAGVHRLYAATVGQRSGASQSG